MGESSAPGVTNDRIRVGFSLRGDFRKANKTARAMSVSAMLWPDQPAVVQAVVDHINVTGGIAGRELEPVYRLHGTGIQNVKGIWKAVGEVFTQEEPVFAVFSDYSCEKEVLAEMLSANNTVLLLWGKTVFHHKDFERWAPYVYAPSAIAGDRLGVVVDELVDMGYFQGNPTIGLIGIPFSRPLRDEVIIPRLTEHGLHVAEDGDHTRWLRDLGRARALVKEDLDAIADRFVAQGVTHVMICATDGTAQFAFPPIAESKGFRPRYAITSVDHPLMFASDAPPAQRENAVGVGWWPFWDVDFAQEPGDNPTADLCLKVMDDAGVPERTAPDWTRWGANVAINVWDALSFLKATLDTAPTVDAEGMRIAATALGDSYPSPATYRTSFADGRFDGAAAVRRLRFDSGEARFQYVDEWIPIP